MSKENTIIVDGSVYYFNLARVCDFARMSDRPEKEILDTYDLSEEEELSLSNKVVREVTTRYESQYDTVKYDLIKTFIIQLITYTEKDYEINKLPFGHRLAFNTMVEEGILIKKED